MTSVLVAFWVCRSSGKSALLFVVAVPAVAAVDADVRSDASGAGPEEDAGGDPVEVDGNRPKASAELTAKAGGPNAARDRIEEIDEMEDDDDPMLDVVLAVVLFPVPFPVLLCVPGPKAANSAPPRCPRRRPAHIHLQGGRVV